MDITRDVLGEVLKSVRETTPLVHSITNYVTVHDVANIIIACGGSWMCSGDLIKAGDFEKIKELTAEAAAIVKEMRG